MIKGCGTTCGCPKISNRESWTYLQNAYAAVDMLREGWYTLDDITDTDWAMVSDVMRQESYLRDLYKKNGEELDKILGTGKSSARRR